MEACRGEWARLPSATYSALRTDPEVGAPLARPASSTQWQPTPQAGRCGSIRSCRSGESGCIPGERFLVTGGCPLSCRCWLLPRAGAVDRACPFPSCHAGQPIVCSRQYDHRSVASSDLAARWDTGLGARLAGGLAPPVGRAMVLSACSWPAMAVTDDAKGLGNEAMQRVGR